MTTPSDPPFWKVKTWQGYLIMAAAVMVGGQLIAGVRTGYLNSVGWDANMNPGILMPMALFLLAPVAIGTSVVHGALNRFFRYRAGWPWLLSGLAYSSTLLIFIYPQLWFVPWVVNPLTLLIVLTAVRRIWVK